VLKSEERCFAVSRTLVIQFATPRRLTIYIRLPSTGC
jgi:hypothetical protein